MKTYLSRRMTALLLAVITLFGLFTIPAGAASSLADAMAEVDVYATDEPLVWLTMNGAVNYQNYTYYNYTSVQTSQVKEIPAYCVDPHMKGVPVLVPEGTAIKYGSSSTVSDPKVCGILGNGYPHENLSVLKLNTKEEAYYATKTALWTYLLGDWSINGLAINPALSGADREAAQRVLNATKWIYSRGMTWTQLETPKLTATPDKDKAYPATINGQACYQQVFTVESGTWSVETVKVQLATNAPAGAVIMDMDDKETDHVLLSTRKPYRGQFKVVYPASSVEGKSGTVQINLNSVVVQYAIYYATSLETDQYGKMQDYMLDTDPHLPIGVSAISRYSADPGGGGNPGDPGENGLRIRKYETGTNIPLEGAVFEVIGPRGNVVGSYSTNAQGVIDLSDLETGNYTVTELTPPKNHLLPERTTQNVTVTEGQTAVLTFWNAPYGNLRVEKVSDTGEKLEGVTIQIKNIVTGEAQSGQTGPGGVIEFTELAPGGYEVRELAGISGWIADTETVQTAAVVTGETATVTFTNKEAPGLRIVKYDRGSHMYMGGVTFAVYRDREFLGNYTTSELGEIFIPNAQPGTYLVYEVDTGDDGHVLDTTPQEIELKAGDGIKKLIFFNDTKPGIHLIKVDSANLSKPIANAKFKIEAIDHSFGPEEFTTDQNGEIDLSKLPANTSYVVTELECPGYVIDEAQRIIHLTANETAHFVFTNSKKPDLLLEKLSNDGTPLAGVSFRLAKIEDASHYLDRTTDGNGEILWEGLEPGVYSLIETATVNDHILDLREHHVELFPGKTSTIVLENDRRPNLTVIKRDADTGEAVPGTVFEVRFADGHSVQDVTTGPDGKGYLEDLLPGVYEISEKSVPEPYLQDAASQLVSLYPNRDREVLFENHKRPSIEIIKENSITHERQANVKFRVWYASNNTSTGEYNDLGVYYTDESGRILLTGPDIYLRDGWYRVKELEPLHGFALADPDTQEAFIPSGTSHTFLFQNRPLSAICVWKYDSVSPNMAIEGAVFQIRYLSGNTSGTGGTVIGTYRTGKNGSFTVTGLQAGTYIIEELSSDGDHVIDTPPQTVYLSGDNQEVIQVYFGNSPKGNLLVKKIDSLTRRPLSDVEFLVTDSKGGFIGDANGRFVTDSAGSFTVSGIAPGTTLVVREVRSAPGYVLDDVPQTATISAGRTVTLEFRNAPKGNLIVEKYDSVTRQPLAGALFKVTTASGELVPDNEGLTSSNGLYTTDRNGQIILSKLLPGTYVVSEERGPDNYQADPTPQTVVVNPGDTQTLRFYNDPLCTLTILKRDAVTKKPLAGAEFLVRDGEGRVIGPNNGLFTTGTDGTVTVSGLAPNSTVVCSEVKAPSGYVLDQTPKTIVVRSGVPNSLPFDNQPGTTLVIRKYIEGTNYEPLAGVCFKVTDGNGGAIGPDDGIYYTDKSGEIVLDGIEPGATVIAREIKTVEGYVLDGTPQDILITGGEVQRLTFWNKKAGGLTIIKKDEETGKRISGVQFEIRKLNGEIVGTYTTDKNGVIYLPEAEKGWYQVVELKAASGYKLDDTPHQIEVKDGGTAPLEITNRQTGSALIHKVDSLTGEGIYGVKFLLSDAKGNPIGTYESDNEGYVYIDKELADGRYSIREVECAEGYILDTQPKTIYVEYGGCTTVTWTNTAIRGQIQIVKKSADYNSVNGLPAGTLLQGATFEIYNERTGNKVDTIVTGANGLASSRQLPLGRYTIRETKAPANYGASGETYIAVLEYSGQIVRMEVTNKSLTTGVSIEKTGPKEAMAGQPVRYVFSRIGNNSNVTLDSFYWRDALPGAVRLDRVVTGTYNFPGTYKIVYKVNNTGDYRTLADSLSTSRSYDLTASPAVLGLASNERVTEIMFVFGQVPAGFAQVEAPMLYCTAVSNLTASSGFVNVADVGGAYNGVWIQAVTRWVTTVYGKPSTLPRTGY